MPYLNVVEVESALQVVGATHPGFTELVTLPHRTWENRVCRAVRVATDLAAARPTVVLFAGVHAREWGGPDILVSFLERLTTAASAGAQISLPGYAVSAADVVTDRRNLCEGSTVLLGRPDPAGVPQPALRASRSNPAEGPARAGCTTGRDVTRTVPDQRAGTGRTTALVGTGWRA